MTFTFLRNVNISSHRSARTAVAAASLAILFALAIIATPPAQAQTLTVLHSFTNGTDGGNPTVGLTVDAAGNFYGTTWAGGLGYGTIFKLEHTAAGWLLTTIYTFAGGEDGYLPGSLVIGPDGNLYGTTHSGGNSSNCGTVFRLAPPLEVSKAAPAQWVKTVLFDFSGEDGAYPEGDLVFDELGNIYGTTRQGGSADWGVIYELAPTGDEWTETVLYDANDYGVGCCPSNGVVLDQAGNLYGELIAGGPFGAGVIYKLTHSQSGWTESTLHAFDGADGVLPQGGLIWSPAGDLYGTTYSTGTIFQLTPSGDSWNFKTLVNFDIYAFTVGKLALDSAGNLYASPALGVYGFGAVVIATTSGGQWTYRSLHEFRGGYDGGSPNGNLVFDTAGNIYGTTQWSVGPNPFYPGGGTIFQITP